MQTPDVSGDAEIVRLLADNRDLPCPGCGYNLRALSGNQCPECGALVSVQSLLARPRLSSLLAGVIALSAGAGLNGLLLIYVAILVLRGRGFPPMTPFVMYNAIGLLVQASALLVWLRTWRRIERMRPGRCAVLVSLCVLVTLANIVVFSWTV